jgi:secreted Zn-dependent insulinase-like peptidase
LCRWEGGSGVDFKVHGFSHKLPLLAAYIFRSLAGLRATADAFARVKESLLRNVSRVCSFVLALLGVDEAGWGGVR